MWGSENVCRPLANGCWCLQVKLLTDRPSQYWLTELAQVKLITQSIDTHVKRLSCLL